MLRERPKSWILDLGLLALVCVALLAPALFAGKPTLVNDPIHNGLPELMRLARGLRAGGTPLWNPHLFAGARPTLYQPNLFYYVLWWPFLMIADMGDPAAFARTGMLLPYLLHMILAAAGTYVFLRHTLSTARVGALAAGVLYAFSPAVIVALDGGPNQATLMAWLPWLAVAGTAFLKRGGALRWAAVTLVLVMANSSGVMHLLVRLYAFTPLLFFLVWLGMKTGSWPTRIGRLAALAGAYLLAAGILAPVWLGIYDAKPMLDSVVTELQTATAGAVQTAEAEGHVPVSHFASMFCPDLFGVVSLHGWGIAIGYPVTHLGHVGGGVVMMAVILYGLVRLLRGGSDANPVTKTWWRAAAGVCVLLIILMMGRHTFLHGPLSLLGGFLVSGPHPTYYQFGACWLLAVLAGLGMAELGAIRQRGQRVALAWLAAGCGLAAVTAAVFYLLSPLDPEILGPKSGAVVRGIMDEHPRLLWYHAMRATGGMRWLLAGPGAYVLVSVIGCAVAARFCPARRLAALALAALLVEYAVVAGTILYVTTNTWLNELKFSGEERSPPKLAHVADLKHFGLVSRASAQAEARGVRWTMAWSRGDNMAQWFGTRALLGHASRPLIKEFYQAVRQVYSGFPYQLHVRQEKGMELKQFMENENVGLIISASGHEFIRLDPVPAFYRQTVVREMDEAEQLEATVSRSFAEACLVLPGTRLEWMQPVEHPAARKWVLGQVTWSRPHADRIEIESHGATAAMTVITECWHAGWQATVDGEPAPVHKVNHHQMAVEVPPGDHQITLRFRPSCITVGLRIAAVSVIVAVGMGVGWRVASGKWPASAKASAGRRVAEGGGSMSAAT